MKEEQRPKSAREPNFDELDEKLKVLTSKLDLTVKFKSFNHFLDLPKNSRFFSSHK